MARRGACRMAVIRPDQIAIVLVFLTALGVLWFVVQRNRAVFARHLSGTSRLRLADALQIGPGDRALILTVDRTEYLVLRVQGAAPVVVPLQPAGPDGAA